MSRTVRSSAGESFVHALCQLENAFSCSVSAECATVPSYWVETFFVWFSDAWMNWNNWCTPPWYINKTTSLPQTSADNPEALWDFFVTSWHVVLVASGSSQRSSDVVPSCRLQGPTSQSAARLGGLGRHFVTLQTAGALQISGLLGEVGIGQGHMTSTMVSIQGLPSFSPTIWRSSWSWRLSTWHFWSFPLPNLGRALLVFFRPNRFPIFTDFRISPTPTRSYPPKKSENTGCRIKTHFSQDSSRVVSE